MSVQLHPPCGLQAGPVHRQIEATIRGLISNLIVKDANPRCQIQIIIQPLELKYYVTPLINCAILAVLGMGYKL